MLETKNCGFWQVSQSFYYRNILGTQCECNRCGLVVLSATCFP